MRFGRLCFGTPLPVVVGVMCGFLWLGSICAKVAEGEQRAVPEPKGAAWPNEWCDPCMAVVLPCSGARGFLPLAGRDAMKSTSPMKTRRLSLSAGGSASALDSKCQYLGRSYDLRPYR